MIDEIIGGAILEYIGAFFKWSFLALVDILRGRKARAFKEVVKGKGSHDKSNRVSTSIMHMFLGGAVMFIIFYLIGKYFL